MFGIDRIEIIDIAGSIAERVEQSKKYQQLINSIYRDILPLYEGENIRQVYLKDHEASYDYQEGIDVILRLKDGSKLTLQEKFLFDENYRTATFETYKNSGKDGGWFYGTSQLYFVAKIINGVVVSYVLSDFALLKIYSNKYDLPWGYREGKVRDKTKFKFIELTDIPKECLIAYKFEEINNTVLQKEMF